MKGFIQRLTLLIHWIGFVIGIVGAALGLYFNNPNSLTVGALSVAFGFFLWVLKWLISGNKSIWPWQS